MHLISRRTKGCIIRGQLFYCILYCSMVIRFRRKVSKTITAVPVQPWYSHSDYTNFHSQAFDTALALETRVSIPPPQRSPPGLL